MKKFVLILVFGVSASVLSSPSMGQTGIAIPFTYAKGKMLYDQACSSCHGVNLDGGDKGPPLVHDYYKPSHHGDDSFYKAALQGTRAHHWNFGDMPAIEGMTRDRMKSIIAFVRYYQKQMKLY